MVSASRKSSSHIPKAPGASKVQPAGGPTQREIELPCRPCAWACPGPQQGGAEPVIEAQVSLTAKPSQGHRQDSPQLLCSILQGQPHLGSARSSPSAQSAPGVQWSSPGTHRHHLVPGSHQCSRTEGSVAFEASPRVVLWDAALSAHTENV